MSQFTFSLLMIGASACLIVTTYCTTTFISNPRSGGGNHHRSSNAFDAGVLSSHDVLGVTDGDIAEISIRTALSRASCNSVCIPTSECILLV